MAYISILSIALELIKLVPNLINKFNTSNAANFSEKIIDVAKIITQQKNEQGALEQLRNNPQLLLEFQKVAMEIDEKVHYTSYKEHKNARLRDMEIFRAGKQNIRAHLMVLTAAIGLLACPLALVMLLKNYDINIPGEIIVIISTIAGIFGACLKDAYAFEFGSSKNNHSKRMSTQQNFLEHNSIHSSINKFKKNLQNNKKVTKRILKIFKKIKKSFTKK